MGVMSQHTLQILKAAVGVAWADGVYSQAERGVLDAIISACALSYEQAAELRRFAEHPFLEPPEQIAAWTQEDRRLALRYAVGMAFADREIGHQERQSILALAQRLSVPENEVMQVILAYRARSQRG
jgi:tellurite resistance protein